MSAGPVRAVLDAVAGGERTVAGLTRSTGLARDVVAAVVEHLGRSGRLAALPPACPATGCGGCPVVECADSGR